MTPPANIRKHFVDWVGILADSDAQKKYETEVPHATVHVELVETFYDLYFPTDTSFASAFSREEAMGLSELEGLLGAVSKKSQVVDVHSVAQLQSLPEWQSVIKKAGAVHQALKKEANQAAQTTPGLRPSVSDLKR